MLLINALKVVDGGDGAVVFVVGMVGAVVLVAVDISQDVRPVLGGVEMALSNLVPESEDARPSLVRLTGRIFGDVAVELLRQLLELGEYRFFRALFLLSPSLRRCYQSEEPCHERTAAGCDYRFD